MESIKRRWSITAIPAPKVGVVAVITEQPVRRVKPSTFVKPMRKRPLGGKW